MYTKIKNLIDANPSRVVGLKQVLRGIEDDAIWCVIMSSDSDGFGQALLKVSICAKYILMERIDSKEQLGSLVGIDVPAAVVGFTSRQVTK